MNVDDIQNDGLADDELLAGGEQSEENDEEQDGSDENSDTETEEEDGADEADSDASDDEGDEEEQPKRKRRTGSERLRRRIEALEAENQSLRSRPQVDGADLEKAVQAEIGDPPKESDYPDYLAYERAMIAYEADKRAVTREVKRTMEGQAARETARQAEVYEAYDDRLEDAEKAIPGLKATIAKADIQVRNHVVGLIVESEKGPLIAHHLAKNPSKVAELNRMSPLAAAKEIGRLESRLSLPKPKTTTSAPPPVAPIRGSAAPAKDPSKMSPAEYRAWRQKGGGK
jgi:hypothetical protein